MKKGVAISALILLILPSLFLSCKSTNKISGRLDIPGALLNYSAEGDGIPCVVFSGSENLGKKLYPDELLDHFTLIHASVEEVLADDVGKITFDKILDDLEKVRQTLNLEKIAVMGHSMFGILPIEYALKYPESVSYAISTGSTPYVTPKFNEEKHKYWESEASEERKKIRKENHEKLQSEDLEKYSESEIFIKGYVANTPLFFFDTQYDMSGLWDGIEINVDFVNHYFGNLLTGRDNTLDYRNIKTPVLVISGKYDFWGPHYLWEPLNDIIPDFTQIVFDNSGHNPMLEIPEEFTSTVVEWMERRRK